MQANTDAHAERLRTRTLLGGATILGIIVLAVLVAVSDYSPAVFDPGASNRLDLWIVMITEIVGPFGIPVGLLAGWFMYANEQYRQARWWLVLPVVWGVLCLAANWAAVHYGPWPMG
jgi:hypothetical protein